MPRMNSSTRTRRPTARRATKRKARGASVRAIERACGRLVRIMAALRAPIGGCPWDVKQTHASLRPYLIEEAYEAVDAIDRGDARALPGELGDVLLQCVFHAQIASESGAFDLAVVAHAISDKLIRRHPHIFTPEGRRLSAAARRRAGLDTAEAVIDRWGQLKAREQAAAGTPARTLAGLPPALPALLRAARIGARVASVGFDWTRPADVLDKVEEEVRELRAAVADGRARTLDEFGDVLFSLANLARHLDLDPETALRHANDKFTTRFTALEADFEARGASVHDATPAQLEDAWTRIKSQPPPPAPLASAVVTARRALAPAPDGPTTSARGSRARRSQSSRRRPRRSAR